MKRCWITALLAALVALAHACNDDVDPTGDTDTTPETDAGDAATDVLPDTAPDETGDIPDLTDSEDQAVDQPDVESCGDLTACGAGDTCADDFTCFEGCCVPATECAAQDQPCTDASFDTDGFVCDLPAGICGRRCDTAEPWNCPLASWCVATDRPAEALHGVCRNSDCDDTCFDPADCLDPKAFTCDAGDGAESGTCVALGQQTNLCLSAGETAEGGDCAGEADAVSAGLPCAAGLRCFDGACVAPCLYDDDDPGPGCAGDPECVPVFVSAGDNQPGICGTACDPFSTGQCPADQECAFAIDAVTTAVTAWYCRDLPGDGLPTVEIEETCSTTEPPTDLCEEGHFCHVETTAGHCAQYCDLVGDLADCPVLPGAPLLGDGVGASTYGEATSYQTVDADVSELDVWDLSLADEALFAGLDSVDFAAGTAYSVLAWEEPDGTSAAVIPDWTAATAALDGGVPYFALYNLSTTSIHLYSDLDAFFDTTLGAGDSSNELTVTDGADGSLGYGFELSATYDTDTVWRDHTFISHDDVPWGDVVDLLVVGVIDAGDGDPPAEMLLLPDDAPTLGDDEAALRLINASASTPSVDVDWGRPALPDEAGLVFGKATSDWALPTVPLGDTINVGVDLHWPADGGGTESYSISGVDRGDIVTVIFWDDPDVGARQILEITRPATPAGGEVIYRLTNVTEQALDGAHLEAALARSVAAPRYPETGAAFAGATGVQDLVVRDATSEDEARLETLSVTMTADMVRGVVFMPTATALVYRTMDFEHAAPTLPGAGSGDAVVRFVHGAKDTDQLLLRERRVLRCVATDVVGVGRCAD